MAAVDSLEIKITSNMQAAGDAIDSLSRKLSGLAGRLNFDTRSLETLGSINGDNIKRLGTGIHALASGMQKIQSVRNADFNRMASGIERIARIPVGNLEVISNSLRPLANGLNALGSANFDSRNLQGMINSLSRLANANIGSLANANFTQLGNSIREFANAASGAAKVEQSTIGITSAVAKLAQAGANIPAVVASLESLGESMKKFMEKMSNAPAVSEKVAAFTQAVAALAGAGNKAKTTADNLGHLAEELKKFMQTMSEAPEVSDSVIRMTTALAGLAGQGGRVSVSANIMSGSFTRLSGFSGKLHGSLGKLAKTMLGLKNSAAGAAGGFKSLVNQLKSSIGAFVSIYGAIRGMKSAIDISSDLTEVQNVVDVTFGNMTNKVEELSKVSIKDFGMSELTTKQIASRFQAMGVAAGFSQGKMSDMSIELTKLAADMASFYNVEQDAVATSLQSVFTGETEPLRKYGLDLTQVTLEEWAHKQGIDAKMASMSQAEKTMLRYQYVMANTSMVQGDFARTADSWSNQVRVLKQSFEALGSIVGGVLINAFKPFVKTLNSVMQKVISFAKTVSDALGQIFGWTFEVNPGGITNDDTDFDDMSSGIEDVADSADDASDAIKNTTKKAKELKANLQGFDKLNVINTEKDTDSDKNKSDKKDSTDKGTGIAGLDTSLVETDSILKKYKSSIKNLEQLGKYIGDALTKAMNSIKWNEVYAKARNFGKGLAEFLNGLISPELFSALGRTVAGALNTALHFLDSFGTTFDWSNFGKSIAAGLAAFLDTFDWGLAGRTAETFGSGIATMLNNSISPRLFSKIGETIASAINTALKFLDSFGTTFRWNNFGKSLGAGLNAFLKKLDWKLYLKNAKTFGTGIANALNSFLGETDFRKVGSSIAQLINGAIIFALSSGKTLKFDVIGKKIADGLNGFFKKLKVKELAQAINVWIKGALKAVTTLLKKTDFEMIGKKIGQFLAELDFLDFISGMASALWEAIKGAFSLLTGLMSEAPLETILIAAFAIMKFAGVGKTIASAVSSSFATSLAGRLGVELSGNAATIRGVLTTALSGAFDGPINTVIGKLSGIAKHVGVAAGAFAQFQVVSGAFDGLISGNESLIAGLGKAATATGVAAAGMYAALGPAGLAIAGITGVVAAIKGINDAYDEIQAEMIGESIHDALANPGGVSIDELSVQVADSIVGIGDSFSALSEKSNQLDIADKNIQDIISEIQLVQEELKAGTITAEEATEKFDSLLGELQTAVSTKIGAINQYMVGAFGEGGPWSKAWEQAGYDASEAVGKTLGLTAEMQTKFDEIIEELSKTDPTSPKWAELHTQLYGIIGETDGLEKALNKFNYSVSAMDVDYSGLVTEEGELDSQAVEDAMSNISTAVKTANDEIDTAGQEVAENLQELIDSARKAGDSGAVEYFSQKLEELPNVVKIQKEQVASQAKEMTDVLQSGLVDNIKKMVGDAEKEWNSLTENERRTSGAANATAYAKKKIESYINNVIKPFSQSIEKEMDDLGVKGAGWSEKAGQEILDGIYNYNYDSPNAPRTESGILNNWKGMIDNVALNTEGYAKKGFNMVGNAMTVGLVAGMSALKAAKEGKNIGEAIVDGISSADLSEVDRFGAKMMKKSIDSTKKEGEINSPSKVYAEIGKYVVEGFLLGLKNNWKDVSNWWKKNTKLGEIKVSVQDFKKAVSAKWKELTKWWGKKELAVSSKFETKKANVSSWLKNVKSWWGNPKLDIKNNFSTTQSNINEWWKKVKDWWGKKLLEVKNQFSTTQANVSSWWKNVKSWWGKPKLDVKNDFATKKSDVVSWWTNVKKWWGTRIVSVKTEYSTKDSTVKNWGSKTVNWLKSGMNAAWSSFSSWFTEKMKKLMNGAISGMNWVLKQVGSEKTLPLWKGYARGTNGLPKDTIGMVNDQKGSTYRELIVPPHGRPFVPKGRNVTLPMQKGTKILPADRTKELLKIIPHFAKGIGDFSGSIFDYVDKPKEILKIGMNKHVDMSDMIEPTLSIAKSAINMFADRAAGYFKKIFETTMSPGIEGALRWMVNIANDDSHGYDQIHRTGPDYDCSSLITVALGKAGLPIGVSTTARMYGQLTKAGFKDVIGSVNISSQSGLKRGDILLAPGKHTAAYLGNGKIVHASINELGKTTGGKTGDQTGREIRVAPYYNKPWQHVLRYFGKALGMAGGAESGSVNYTPSAGVEQWRGLAAKALQMTGHYSASNLSRMLMQMQTESSGNPNAINLWDSNAKKGTPSKGLMQVIDPTFRAYALPPYNTNIYDPLSNMIAAIRYVANKPGGISRWWGRGKGYASGIGKINLSDLIKGYASGGFPASGQLFMARENGISELVGQIGNRTAVMNNTQIVKSVSDGVAQAIKKTMPESFAEALKKAGGTTQRAQEFLADAKISLSVESNIATKVAEVSKSVADNVADGISQDFTSLDQAIEILRNQVITGIVTAEDEMKLYGSQAVSEYSDGMNDEQEDVYETSEDTGETVELGVSSAEEAMRSAGNGIIYQLQEGMSEKWTELTEWINEKKEAIIKSFEDMAESMKPVGTDIVTGILEGIESVWESVEQAVQKIKDTFASVKETAAKIDEIGKSAASSASAKASSAGTSTKTYKAADLTASKNTYEKNLSKYSTGTGSFSSEIGSKTGTEVVQTISAATADAFNRIVVPVIERDRDVNISMKGDLSKIFTAMVEKNEQEKIRTGRYGFQRG